MPVNLNGYNLSEASGLVLGATGTKIVAASYGVKDPALPGLYGCAAGYAAARKGFPYPVNNVNLNNGSYWSTGSYRFTCPVAGIYYTSFGGIVGTGTPPTYGYYMVMLNDGAQGYFAYHNNYNYWNPMHFEMQFRAAAGDTISWSMNAAPGPDSGTGSGGYGDNHNAVAIWLIG